MTRGMNGLYIPHRLSDYHKLIPLQYPTLHYNTCSFNPLVQIQLIYYHTHNAKPTLNLRHIITAHTNTHTHTCTCVHTLYIHVCTRTLVSCMYMYLRGFYVFTITTTCTSTLTMGSSVTYSLWSWTVWKQQQVWAIYGYVLCTCSCMSN